MNLLITKSNFVIYEGIVESKEEANLVLHLNLPVTIQEVGDSFQIFWEGKPINPTYTKEWKIQDILYDALKSNILSKQSGRYKFYKFEKL